LKGWIDEDYTRKGILSFRTSVSPYRCQLCGYVYLGRSRPDKCPHCGADETELRSPVDYMEIKPVRFLTDVEYRDLVETMRLEAVGEMFYRECEDVFEGKDTYYESIFRRLARHEDEHIDVVEDALDMDKDDVLDEVDEIEVPDTVGEILDIVVDLEMEAIMKYTKFFRRTDKERLKYIYECLIDVETEHKHLAVWNIGAIR